MRVLVFLVTAALAYTGQPAPDFEREVKPILRASCFGCHSGAQPQAQLRLDVKALAMKGGTSGPAIVPGHSEQSRLMRRILGAGGEARMPMGRPPLAAEQIDVLKRWIDAGAAWPDRGPAAAERPRHWAYVKPVRPKTPAVKNTAWVRNPIDAFVLARLEKEGLRPSPEASREVLIRRLSLDLTGLPPTVPEVDAFVADRRPDAYEQLVERLLASPHYGERWARPWLDQARYADTNGYEADRSRTIWKYRDWVIQALNRDMPFDQFTIEQLAGDMLPNPTTDQLIATGFHRNTMFNEEGGVDQEEAHWLNLVDRVNTTATVWLGSTIGCAQCHNHKYDPFTQKEYYQLLAFFNNTVRSVGKFSRLRERELDLPTPEQAARRKEIEEELRRLDAVLKTNTPELEAEQAAWEQDLGRAAAAWRPLKPKSLASAAGTRLSKKKDAVLAGGPNPANEEYVIEAKLPVSAATALRIEALPHESLPRGGPGRDSYGNFFLTAVEAEVVSRSGAEPVRFAKLYADDGRLNEKKFHQLWTVDASREERRLPRQLVLVAAAPFGSEGDTVRIRIRQHSEFGGQGIGHFRLSVTDAAAPKTIVEISAKLRPLLAIAPEARSREQREQLAEHFRTVARSLETPRRRRERLRKELDKLGIVTTLVLSERPSFERPWTVIRNRGSFLDAGEKVYAAVPAALPRLPESEMPNRLGLARWLVSRENPLTARVSVNRVWEAYFGRGIVETSEDFGSQGSRPTHPELLDWLAVEFMENGWSLKKLHRLIVTSSAYRQSSAVTPQLLERDPYNQLLARGPRFRVEAEMIRDVVLAAGGLLSPKIGGPSVFPYQPAGIWDLPYNDEQWEESRGEDRYRRGLYTFWRRTAPYPAFLNFDATSRESCTVRRVRTNTPLQALTVLNDPAFFEAAQGLARRIVKEAGADARDRAIYGFRLCVARAPTEPELERIVAGLEQERGYFASHAGEAARVAGTPDGAPELAAWTMIANVLLTMDETVTKE